MLDRAIVSSEWKEKFRSREVEVLTSGRSDHNPILLSAYGNNTKFGRKNKVFRFEVSWMLDT